MYDNNLKRKWDEKGVLDYAVTHAVTHAVKEVREQEQMKAHEEKLDIAREMKKEGFPIAQISRFTKLSIEEIEEL